MSREPDRVTRRAVLRGAAVAGATALVRPAVGLARAGSPAGVFSHYVGTVSAGETRPIAAPGVFSLVGVQWRTPTGARIELRTRRAPGAPWGPWVSAAVRGHDGDGSAEAGAGAGAARADEFGEPIWTGPAAEVQLRSAGVVEGVRLHFVAPPSGAATGLQARAAQGLALAQPILAAGPGQPPILARSAWAHGRAPHHVPEYGTVKLAFVHHSETPNGYSAGEVPSILLSIFAYHRYVRGFFDIAYNFAIDAFGRIWEARAGGIDEAVIGAHAGGYNQESTGMVVLGSFMSVAPSQAALGALTRLLAWKLSLHGLPALGRATVEVNPSDAFYTPFAPGAHVSLPRIAGHRDGDQTSCPGDAFYARLPSIRPRVAALAGKPAHLSIVAPVPAHPPGAPVTLAGRLLDVSSGAPLAGAPLEIQQIGAQGGEATIATLSTAADGSWNYVARPSANIMLRALHRPAPAAVSDIVILAVAPALTVSVVSTSPLMVSGTVTPAGPRVTVDLYRVGAGGHRHLVSAKAFPATGGSFSGRIRHPGAGPGRYVLIARTAQSAQFAAGASAPVPVSL
ncbi:MAG: N-acetylmuramoyl-L-alanine amidase [Solirubrobacterales bacterium]|nr:N-acetylmuramoyl-L-alanine amidase [Solirubrobacterales bacterium]